MLYKYKTLDMEQIKKIKEKFEEGMIVTEKDTEDELRYYSIRKDIETYGNWWIESFIWENNFNEYNNIKLYKEFIEMKKKEIRVKTALYSAVDKFIVEKQDMVDLVMRIYETLKNTPTENLQQELISQIVNVIHKDEVDNEVVNKTENE